MDVAPTGGNRASYRDRQNILLRIPPSGAGRGSRVFVATYAQASTAGTCYTRDVAAGTSPGWMRRSRLPVDLDYDQIPSWREGGDGEVAWGLRDDHKT